MQKSYLRPYNVRARKVFLFNNILFKYTFVELKQTQSLLFLTCLVSAKPVCVRQNKRSLVAIIKCLHSKIYGHNCDRANDFFFLAAKIVLKRN